MMTWQEACNNARQTLKGTASMLLDKRCVELFEICYSLSDLAEEAEEMGSSSVACGLYAATYRLAGSAKIIANTAEMVLSVVDEHCISRATGTSVNNSSKFRFMASNGPYQPLLEKLQDYQFTIQDFAKALQDNCHNDLMHLVSELRVLGEHPFVVANDSFQNRLREQHDGVEAFSENLYELGSQLEADPVVNIDATIFNGAMH